VPGSGFISGLLQRLEQRVAKATDMSTTPNWGGGFTAQVDRPTYALQPLTMMSPEQLEEGDGEEVQRQQDAAAAAADSSSSSSSRQQQQQQQQQQR
jgi:hypothetical protein